MRNTVSLGTLFGIELRASFSWLIAFGLLAGYLGAGYFPTTYPGWTSGARLSAVLATALLFFASLVAHELGHNLAAKRFGLSSPRITLSAFGGQSGLGGEPERPRDEFLIAAAGPLASLLLALGFGLLSWAGPDRVGLPLAAFSRWLGLANLVLALFHLLPGLPLDGGKVLRAATWGLTRNPRTATLIAGVGGRSVAFGLILWGVQLIFGGNWPVGLLVTLLGWHVDRAALESAAYAVLQNLLGGHTAREAMMTDCPRVGPTMMIQKLVDEVALTSGRSCFLVLGGTRVTGLISRTFKPSCTPTPKANCAGRQFCSGKKQAKWRLCICNFVTYNEKIAPKLSHICSLIWKDYLFDVGLLETTQLPELWSPAQLGR